MSREFSKAAQNYPPSGIRKMFDLDRHAENKALSDHQGAVAE